MFSKTFFRGLLLMGTHQLILRNNRIVFDLVCLRRCYTFGDIACFMVQWDESRYCIVCHQRSHYRCSTSRRLWLYNVQEKNNSYGFKWNVLKVENVSTVSLGAMLNYKCCQLLYLGWKKWKTSTYSFWFAWFIWSTQPWSP